MSSVSSLSRDNDSGSRGSQTSYNTSSRRRRTSEYEQSVTNILSLPSAAICDLRNDRVASLTANKLRFGSLGLIGRELEMEMLQKCLNRCRHSMSSSLHDDVGSTGAQESGETTNQQEGENDGKTCRDQGRTRELVFLRGLSGTGKTCLASTFASTSNKNGRQRLLWTLGKFDLYLRDEPLFGFVEAFEDLCSQVLERFDKESYIEFQSLLLETIEEDEIPFLTSMIPNIQQILDNDGTNRSKIKDGLSGDAEANNQRMKNVFRKLCRVLTNIYAPIIIILDDIQWADPASLDLLDVLINDCQNSGLFIIACFRSDEADDVHVLRKRLIQNKRPGTNIHDIEIGNISLDNVHHVITTLLSIDDADQTLELARIAHKRTAGNIFFLIQYIIMLKEEELLEFNLGMFRWKWDVQRIETETAVSPNVVGMVTDRIFKLRPELLRFLQLASCLGSMFHDQCLSLAWQHVVINDEGEEDISMRQDVATVFNWAVEGDFLERCAPHSHQWLHDAIQEAAMSTIAPERIDALKCRLGMVLLDYLTEGELERELFVVANLLAACQPNHEPKVLGLFLRAAEKAASVAAFQSAIRYANTGIAILPPECWENCFDQSLRLFSVATEASGYLGQVDDMLTYSEIVLDHPSLSIFDKLRVYFVKLEYLQNNGESSAALDLGLQILRKLGCVFPKTKWGQAVQTMRVIQKFKKKPPTPAILRSLPPMTNRTTKETVKVIFRLEACFYYTKQIFLYALASARTIEIVLEHGLCDYSGGAFFALGNVLSVLSGDLKYLARWCELSVLMTQLVPSGHHESRVQFATCCGFSWSQPVHSLPKHLMTGFKQGLKVGDTESAMWNCTHFLYFEFMAGKSLGILEERCQHYISYMVEVKRNEAALVSAPLFRLVLDLIRSVGSSATISSSIEGAIGTITQTSPVAPYFSRALQNMRLCYRREYVTGAKFSIQRGNELLGNLPNQPIGQWDLFLRGVCLYAAAKTTGKRSYLRHARRIRSTLEKWLSQGNLNVRHHAALLAAEDFSLRKKFEDARRSYESSIVAASRGGFVHDAAIANERYAICLLDELKDRENARFHFAEADQLYREWGSDVVADGLHLDQMRLSESGKNILDWRDFGEQK